MGAAITPVVSVTIGGSTYTAAKMTTDERVFGASYTVDLDNSAGTYDSADFEGYPAVVNISPPTSGALPSGWVYSQEKMWESGTKILRLNIIDGWMLLAACTANVGARIYNDPDQADEYPAQYDVTIKDMLDDIVGYIGCTVTVIDDDSIVDTLKPRATVNNLREGAQTLLSYTKGYLKWTGSNFNFIVPSEHAIAQTYAASSDDAIFVTVTGDAITIPNKITVVGTAYDESTVSSSATDSTSITRLGKTIERYVEEPKALVVDAAGCLAMATGILAKIQAEGATGVIRTLHHYDQDVLDKVQATDVAGNTVTGYIHRIVREYDRGEYSMTMYLGGVASAPDQPYRPPSIPPATTYVDGNSPTWWFDFIAQLEAKPAFLPVRIDDVFSAIDYNTVAWTAGKIYTANGEEFSFNAGNSDTILGTTMATDGTVYYIYYDSKDAAPATLKMTTSFSNVVGAEKILLAFAVASADTSVDANVVTAIGGKENNLFATTISAINANLGLITAGELRIGTFTAGHEYDFGYYTGFRLWMDSGIGVIAGYDSGTIQWYSDTNGKLYAGGGSVYLDEDGLWLVGESLFLYYSGSIRGYLEGGNGAVFLLSTTGNHIQIQSSKGLLLEANAGAVMLAGVVDPTTPLEIAAGHVFLNAQGSSTSTMNIYSNDQMYLDANDDIRIDAADNVYLYGDALYASFSSVPW